MARILSKAFLFQLPQRVQIQQGSLFNLIVHDPTPHLSNKIRDGFGMAPGFSTRRQKSFS
jgi:hypothetical protein